MLPQPFPSRLALRPLAAASVLAVFAACSGGSDEPAGPTPVAAVAFATTSDTLLVGQSRQLTVQLRDAHGRSVPNASISWRSGAPTVATVDDDGTVRALAVGESDITATANGRSAELRLVVRPVPVAAVSIDGAPGTLSVGSTVQLVATTRDSAGGTLSGRSVAFASSAPAVLGVSQTGLLSALAEGEAVVSAASEGRTGSVTVRVSAVPVASVEIVPSAVTLTTGQSLQFSVVPRGAAGQPLASRTASYRTTNPAVATVSPAGVVQAVAVGSGAIVAEVEGKVGTATVTVVAPGAPTAPAPTPTTPTPAPTPTTVAPPALPSSPGDGSYTMKVQWVGTPDSRAASVVDATLARWGRAITGDLPNVVADVPVDGCYDGQPAERVAVDDLLIYVRVVAIDGANGTLARAGPCMLRNGSSLPAIGVVELDSADLAKSASVIESVLTHEFGHVLGIGTLWPRLALLHGTTGDDPLFLGQTTADAYKALGGATLPPVEGTGGQGTRLGHWRESTFKTELMTGWISYGTNPMSRMTIASLRDLGYQVDLNAADAYSLPTASVASAQIVGGKAAEIVDELIRPRFVIESGGRTRRLP